MCIGIFKKENFEIVNNPQEAEIIVVNTCGFIESAKEEAINCILEMANYKVNGNCKYLIAMGCLVQRYKKDLEKSIPEVDLFLSIDEYQDFWEKISKLINRSNLNTYFKNLYDDLMYSDDELDYIFTPIFKQHGLVYNQQNSIISYFPKYEKKRICKNGDRKIYYRFKL